MVLDLMELTACGEVWMLNTEKKRITYFSMDQEEGYR